MWENRYDLPQSPLLTGVRVGSKVAPREKKCHAEQRERSGLSRPTPCGQEVSLGGGCEA